MSNVVKLYTANAANDPDAVLEQAVGVYDNLVVIGYDTEGELEVRASLNWDKQEIAYAVQTFLSKLYAGKYDGPEE
jgi:hypothetical protein